MMRHAFVVMPFGSRPGQDGPAIDFERIFDDYMLPALHAAGLKVFRTRAEGPPGEADADMLQHLLMADVVVADITLDDPKVWYALGVRHALRASGVFLVQATQGTATDPSPCDHQRLRYHLKAGGPDPDTLIDDRQRLSNTVCSLPDAQHGTSPIHHALPHLREPDWRTLLPVQRNALTGPYAAWAGRLDSTRPGDILVLADEAPCTALHIAAWLAAGDALMRLRHWDFALEQFDRVLELEPGHTRARRRRASCLARLGRVIEAREAVSRLVTEAPEASEAPETRALAGSIDKSDWISRWARADAAHGAIRARAASENAPLSAAIEHYRQAFMRDPSRYRAGLNALTLMLLRRHLGCAKASDDSRRLSDGLQWSIGAALALMPDDYRVRSSDAEYCLLQGDLAHVREAYRHATAVAGGDWHTLDSSRRSLCLLRDLGFRPAETAAAFEIIDAALARTEPPFVPRQVFLFSGHMADAPDRATPRFPAGLEPAAAAAIGATLDALGAGPGDLALTQGASGGDILFLEACKARQVRLHLMLPLPEPEFLARSVAPARHGARWRARYDSIRHTLDDPPRVLPDELGSLPEADANPFERCNRWLLATALSWGIDKVSFICLWNGEGGDGPGGTAHMHAEMKRRTGKVSWIDTRTLPHQPA
ncbi:MAG: hypothetical protein C0607_05555 [Azoarcus sp.]|nr:MAG: hypothetical protein C0607_05555 [Azoarcus sp.]